MNVVYEQSGEKSLSKKRPYSQHYFLTSWTNKLEC